MHDIGPHVWGGRALEEGGARDFLKLPSGDYIRPAEIDAIRVQAVHANRSTGEVNAKVFVEHRASWFTVIFDHLEDAQSWADALARLCESINRNRGRTKSVGRHEVHDMIAALGDGGKHAAPGDRDEAEDAET